MRGVVKLEALRGLRAHIETQIPELKDRIIVVQSPPDHHLPFPSLAIVGTKFRHSSAYEDVVERPTNHSAVICNGAWDTRIQLRFACTNEAKRFEFEERLSNLFFQTEDAPGILCTQITACPQLGKFLAAWDLQDSDWEEEYAFSSQEWAVLQMIGTIPSLVLRENVYTIQEMRMGLTGDLTYPETSEAFDQLSPLVRINADGSIEAI